MSCLSKTTCPQITSSGYNQSACPRLLTNIILIRLCLALEPLLWVRHLRDVIPLANTPKLWLKGKLVGFCRAIYGVIATNLQHKIKLQL